MSFDSMTRKPSLSVIRTRFVAGVFCLLERVPGSLLQKLYVSACGEDLAQRELLNTLLKKGQKRPPEVDVSVFPLFSGSSNSPVES